MFEQTKDLGDETRVGASNSLRAPRLAQVLTREPRCPDTGVGDRSELANVRGEWNSREVRTQDALRGWIDLAEKLRAMPRLVEADLDTPDAGEQSHDGEFLSAFRRRSWAPYIVRHPSILESSDDVTNIRSQA
jgi:hypothetical protein